MTLRVFARLLALAGVFIATVGASCRVSSELDVLSGMNRKTSQTVKAAVEELVFVKEKIEAEGEVSARVYLKAKGYGQEDIDRLIEAARTLLPREKEN